MAAGALVELDASASVDPDGTITAFEWTQVAGAPVLVYRYRGQVFAMGAVCGHEGGPLEEGSFEGYCVTCPWHQSVYDLRDGSVVHGPTTYAEPIYETRTLGGRIEVRVREQPATAEAKQLLAQVVESAQKR